MHLTLKSFAQRPKSSLLNLCIVLYLYIYIALLAVHTNQKRNHYLGLILLRMIMIPVFHCQTIQEAGKAEKFPQ